MDVYLKPFTWASRVPCDIEEEDGEVEEHTTTPKDVGWCFHQQQKAHACSPETFLYQW